MARRIQIDVPTLATLFTSILALQKEGAKLEKTDREKKKQKQNAGLEPSKTRWASGLNVNRKEEKKEGKKEVARKSMQGQKKEEVLVLTAI